MSGPPRPPPDPLAPVESAIVDHLFVLQPGYAVFLGLHRYDGLLPDLTREGTDRWIGRARELLKELAAVPLDGLPPGRRLDAQLLGLLLESPLFDLVDARELERNPMSYAGALSLTAYIAREYAPLPQRVDAIVRLLDAAPGFLAAGRARLDERIPEPFLTLTQSIASGLPAHFAETEAIARAGSAALGDRVAAARGPAEAAVADFLSALEREYFPRRIPDFALGAEKFQRLLWVREGLTTPFDQIEEAGWADLRRNQARLDALAAGASPPGTVDELLESLYRKHRPASALVPFAQGCVEEARTFVVEHALATIPEPDLCRVEETPVYGRALSTASMNPPGPFDTSTDEGIYYVTPVDPAWPAPRQEEWLRSLNDAMLRNITVHEVYPGHYLQFLHFRRQRNASLARKVFFSASFVEGWAHYCEQLAIEAGFGRGGPEAEAAQLHDALLRNCRLLAAIALHARGGSVEAATELFMREAHMERLPAEREAIRGTFNPEYFCYTLGKLAILDARAGLLASRYAGSLRRFHDTLLGFGAPPVGVLPALLASAA
ncbi:MAG TPA: DUF885 domain-containing protein [Thermoplasmata archaeon]|nr:DUF885 domain-containing protein [Thermoplasmata archaeon]